MIINALFGGLQQRSGQTWMDDRFFPQFADMRPTKTGKILSPEQCLENATVFACVRVLAEGVGVLSRGLYRRRADGGREVVDKDPRHWMLSLYPNREQTRSEFEWFMVMQELLYGNAFAQLIRNGNGVVCEMWPLQSKNMKVARATDGSLVYRYKIGSGNEKDFTRAQIHHRKGPSLDGIVGLSVFELAMNSMALGLALEEYCCRIFENDASPRGLLVHEGILDKESKDIIREGWDKQHKGLGNRGKIAILDNGLDFKPMGMTNDVAQFIESRKDQREEIASWFRIPQHMVGVLTRSTNNNIEQQSKEFIRDTLVPNIERIEQAFMRDLLNDAEKRTLFIEHKAESLLRGDFPEQMAWNTMELQNGVRSINEVRILKNLNPIGPEGDKRFIQLNMQDIEDVGEEEIDPATGQPKPGASSAKGGDKEQKPPPVSDKTDPGASTSQEERAGLEAFKPILDDVWSRLHSREGVALGNMAKRAKSLKDVDDWAAEFLPDHFEKAEAAIVPVLDTIRLSTGMFTRAQQKEIVANAVNGYERQVRSHLEEAAKTGDLSKVKEACQAVTLSRREMVNVVEIILRSSASNV